MIQTNRKQSDRSYSTINQIDLLNDDEFINPECDVLLGTIDEFSSVETRETVISAGIDLNITFKAFLLKTFIECSLFEALLDLYFGLPISFSENNYNYSKLNLNSAYQNLSLKCLNLFVNLYHLANNLFNNEYCIDNFHEMNNLNNSKYYNKGIFTQLKKLSLVNYLNMLNGPEREKEVILFLTEFNTKKESIKNGSSTPSNELSRISFFTQQFLAHSGYLKSSKFEIELEILNLSSTHQFVKNTINATAASSSSSTPTSHSILDFSFFLDRRESKKSRSEIEKKLEEQIDLTWVLQFDMNISNLDSKNWNWFEIIKLFELYLLTSSSIMSRFSATQDALFLSTNKLRTQTFEKLLKCLIKLFNFFNLNKETLSALNNSDSTKRNRYSSMHSNFNSNNYNITDLISCSGCYLIDFTLNQNINVKNLSKLDTSSKSLNQLEFYLGHFMQNIKLYLTIEFFPSTNSARNQPRFITKDSIISYYILFIGHLTGSNQGDILLESFKIYDLLIRIIESAKDINIMKLIISTFNYYVSIKSRLILEKCMNLSVSQETEEFIYNYSKFKVYALKLIFNTYRANSSKFEAFFIDIIINSIITNLEMNTHDYFEIEFSLNLVENFLILRPDLISPLIKLNSINENKIDLLKKLIVNNDQITNKLIKIKTKLILIRLLLHKDSIETMSIETISQLASDWRTNKMDFKYYKLIERTLFNLNAINPHYIEEIDETTRFDIETNEETKKGRYVTFYRKINDPTKNDNVYSYSKSQSIPIHFNSILIRSKKFIENDYFINNEIEDHTVKQLKTIKNCQENNENCTDSMLKASLWSIGSLFNCENGFKYFQILNQKHKIFTNLFQFSSCLIKLTETYKNLSVRATGMMCLHLISKTSTGANLIGKIGWHTFQIKKFMENKAPFYSMLSSFHNNDQDSFNYSPLDTAVALFNLNRNKAGLNLKTIQTTYDYTFTPYEIGYLREQDKFDLININDEYFIKTEDDDETKFGFENFTIPMKQSLISVDSNIYLDLEKLELLNENNSSAQKNKNKEQIETDQIKLQIINLINKISPVINLDNLRNDLYKLKKENSNKFDLALHSYISKQVLSKHKIKFQFRKFIQELFFDTLN